MPSRKTFALSRLLTTISSVSIIAMASAAGPKLANLSGMDRNQNKIDDLLDQQLSLATAQAGSQPTRVIMVFDRQPTQAQMERFQRLGGTIDYVYKAVGYGWNGTLPLGAVLQARNAMGQGLSLIAADRVSKLHMDEATRNGRVRSIWAPGFTGSTAGYRGSASTTIAILDTGLDGTHTDLAGRQAWWHDYSSSAAASPVDYFGHGSHVAGIALGTGAAVGVDPTSLSFTASDDLSSVGTAGSFYPAMVHVPSSGSINLTATWLGGGSTRLGWLYGADGTTQLDWSNYSNSLTSPITLTGSYSQSGAVHFTPYLGQSSPARITKYAVYGSVTFAGLGDGFSPLSGVAPGVRWAGCKVFATDGGTAYNSVIESAIDDMVARRATLGVKVINMSLGGGTDAYMRSVVNNAVNNGIVVVVSAGNSGPTGTIGDPGTSAKAITVAASNDVNQLTDYSSTWSGTPDASQDYKPDVTAPGGSMNYSLITSVDSNSSDAGVSTFADKQANDYTPYEGTSMASPFVAGCAALVIQALEDSGTTWSFSSDQCPMLVKTLLCATSTETNTTREGNSNNPTLGRSTTPKDYQEGYGMINPDAAIEAIRVPYTWGGTLVQSTVGGAFGKRAWGRSVTLWAGARYQIALNNPTGGDFDLYLYSATPGTNGNPVILASSCHAGNGVAESIDITRTTDAKAFLVVKRVAGNGEWSMSSTETPLSWSISTAGSMNAAPGSTSPVTITLANTVIQDTTFALSSSDSRLTLPATATIAAGSTTTTVNATTPDAVSTSFTATLTAIGAGSIHTATLDVLSTATLASKVVVQNKTAGYGEPITLGANLQTPGGVRIGGRTLHFLLNGVEKGTAVTDSTGWAYLSVTAPTPYGTYPIKVDFTAADATYKPSTGTGTLTVGKRATKLLVPVKSVPAGNAVPLQACLLTVVGGARVPGKTCHFSVDGVEVGTAVTTSVGWATFTYRTAVTDGGTTKPVTVSFSDTTDPQYGTFTRPSTLTVDPATTKLLVGSPTVGQGETINLSAKLATVAGNLQGKTLHFNIDGVEVGTAVTASTGYAFLSYTAPGAAGSHSIAVTFDGDSQYAASNGAGTITVTNQRSTKMTVLAKSIPSGSTVTLQACLLLTTGTDRVAGGTIRFQVNGADVGSATTTSTGWASLGWKCTLPAGSYTIRALFDGDANYLASNGSATLTVTP